MDHKASTSRTRRQFLKTAAGAAIAAPYVTSGLRAAPANGKLNHASFGASGMAWSDVNSLNRSPHFNLVAVADVDTRRFAQVKKKFPDVRVYADWRELLEKEGDKIDSVNVSTPDHMHGPIGMTALQKGKHMYGQKPLAQNLHECRRLREKASEKGVMSQMGIQISSAFTERLAVRIVQDGTIGKIKAVHSFSNKKWGDLNPVPDKSDPVPEGFNWDHWLGVAAERPYINGYYHPGNWRKRRDFGTGTFGDMGCHIFSGWYRALGLTAPLKVKSTGPASNKDNWAINAHIEYVFPKTKYTAGDTVPVTWYDGDARPPADIAKLTDGKVPGQGSIIIGTDGVMLAPHMASPTLYPREKFKDFRYPKLTPRDHYMEFVDCCLANDKNNKPSANFDYSGPLTETVLLGCLGTLFPNEELEWDVAKCAVSNNTKANAQVKRSYRKGWEVAGF